jgi:hypothetical protein
VSYGIGSFVHEIAQWHDGNVDFTLYRGPRAVTILNATPDRHHFPRTSNRNPFMIVRILRSLGAVVAGLLTVVVLVTVGEALGHWLFPMPPGIDSHDGRSIGPAIEAGEIPLGALASIPVAWIVAALGGSWVAARQAGCAPLAHGLTVGAIELALTLAYMLLLIPQSPLWIWAAALVGIPFAAWLGAWLAGR